MSWLLLALACAGDPGPAAPDSRSAALAQRAAEVGRRAEVLAERTRELEGLFDQLREGPPEQHASLQATIAAKAKELQVEARAIQAEVAAIEEAARVY